MPGDLLGWTAKTFERDMFSAVLKSNISLDGTARGKVIQFGGYYPVAKTTPGDFPTLSERDCYHSASSPGK